MKGWGPGAGGWGSGPGKWAGGREILTPEHLATSCKSSYICHKCNGRHHIRICTFSKNENPPQNNTTQTQGDRTGSLFTNLSTNKNSILLQIALATITSPSEELRVETRLLFDSGSQRTYISEHLRKEIKLPTIRQEKNSY